VVKKSPEIDELLSALEQLTPDETTSDGFYSAHELAVTTGHSPAWVLVKLKRLQEMGRLEVGKRSVKNLINKTNIQPVYKILPEKKVEKCQKKLITPKK